MAREEQREPRCRNSWRPSDDPLSSEKHDVQRQRPSPVSPARPSARSWAPESSSRTSSQPAWFDQQPTERQTEARRHPMSGATTQAMPEPPAETLRNPNLISVVLRRSRLSKVSSPAREFHQDEEQEDERSPLIWHTSFDDLVRRTAHDYDLVMNYERDAEGGQRWLPEDIATIRNVGKHLHGDIFALKRWQRVVAEQGDQDKKVMMYINRDAKFLKLLCERVQRAINKYEQKCGFELLRDGVYAQDENGNFYKPIPSQQHVAEGGFLQDVAQHSIGNAEGGRPALHPEEHYSEPVTSSRRYRTPPKAYTSRNHMPKRNLAFDFASQRTPFDKFKEEVALQKSFTTLQSPAHRPDRVLNDRISKTHQGPPPACKHRTPSPSHRDQTLKSDAHSIPDIKVRGCRRNNRYDRNGVSRRQAKRDRARERRPEKTAGRLGNHILYY